jgi:hypothetical protein
VPSRQPSEPLILWGYTSSPFVKVVTELLCEMELPYLFRTVARGSPKREEMFQKYGHFQVSTIALKQTGSFTPASARATQC